MLRWFAEAVLGGNWVSREARESESGHGRLVLTRFSRGSSERGASWMWNSRVRSHSCAVIGVWNTQRGSELGDRLGSAGAKRVKIRDGLLSLGVEGSGNTDKDGGSEA